MRTAPLPRTRSTWLAAGGAAVVAGGLATGLLWDGPAAERSAAGTTIGGLPAGGLTAQQLRAVLQDAEANRPPILLLQAGRRRIAVPSGQVGLDLDLDATVQRALDAARHPLLRGRAPAPCLLPVLRAAGAEHTETVTRVVARARVVESHGGVAVRDGRLAALPPADGQQATADAVSSVLRATAVDLTPGSTRAVAVPVERVPAHVTLAQVEQAVRRADLALTQDLTITAGPRSARPTRGSVAAAVRLTPVLSGFPHDVVVAVDDRDPTGLLARLSSQLSTGAREPVLAAPQPEALLTDKGSTSWTPPRVPVRLVTPGVAGQRVSVEEVRDALDRRLRGDPGAMGVRPVAVLPRSSDADASRVDAVLGTFTTLFACCQPRVTNITVMARALDGLLLAPGQQFSLNDTIGRRTTAKGYVDAPFILDGELSSDVGGGVSQVATTLLNAALFAGLQLDRHQAHSFYISRYPPGREATVNYPGIDLRFTNDTASPVLLRTRVTPTSLTVALYGRGDGRRVVASSGPRRALPGRDFAITISRTVTVGGVSRTSTFTTRYNRAPEEH